MAKPTPAKGPRTIRLSDLSHDAVIALKRRRGSRHILRSLARGEREITVGKSYDLDDVLKEADRLLADR